MNKHAYAARQCATYFQVPLCAFAFGGSEKERLDAIIHFAVVDVGLKHWRKLMAEERQRFIESTTKSGFLPRGYDSGLDTHCIAACGASVTGVKLGNVRSCLAKHKQLRNFTDSFQQRHGPDAIVRLKTTLVFEARDGKGITPAELSVLAAIYSVIGRKQGPVRILQDRIRWLALGYKTKAVMEAELPKRTDGARPLSDWILRSTLNNLQRRKFFVRVTYGRRLSYYSHRMTEKQLRTAVCEMKTFAFANKRLRRLDDEEMTDAIRNQRAILTGRPPAAPNAKPLQTTEGFALEDFT